MGPPLPKLPFPFPFQVGVDIIKTQRLHPILKSPNAARFLRRILTPKELMARPFNIDLIFETDKWYRSKSEDSSEMKMWPEIEITNRTLEYVAGRWAAKEAVLKAHPWRWLYFHDIEVLSGRKGERNGPETTTAETVDPFSPLQQALKLELEKHNRQLGKSAKTADELDAEPTLVKETLEEAGRQQHGITPPSTRGGPPVVTVMGHREGVPDQEALVSISHDGGYAIAVCMGFDPNRMGVYSPIKNSRRK
ncbi:hypothetical protein B0T26DRAFT_757762 [Lasiosphaeria miniovina]|uniref:4'-phosphopantetheinyl transferase domain-containing protein n=1 Tax=Lasiosphaeria miniovina TaxID=1954250 RepID=A0AA39ZQM5_9PEZI|nr:uncharacterized protein B0T26DRAFT_757762 [Lasiosphaeria miniovina]KAK0701773.1 hypothetical protein B0T26DRAFT_757762 [Lasiosphaeria miniovina]